MSDTENKPAATAKVKGGVVVYLQVKGATKAAHFYERAFGAEIAVLHPEDDRGRTMHIHLYINGGSVMMSDFYPEHGHPEVPAQGFGMMLPVDDIDMWWARAVEAGAEVVMPISVMFWGDRYGQLRDPFGILWALNEGKKS